MAVSGEKPSLTRSILLGSDEDMPVCLPCERGGRSVEAGGFCRTCNEHLCQACYKSHLLPKPLANHVLLDKSMMPRVAPPPDDMCSKHPTEQLEYYCKNHDKLECNKCVNVHYKTCEDVSYIQDICDDIEETQEFKTLYKTLTGIEHDVVHNKTEIATNLTDIQTNVNDAKASIHSFRGYLNQQLDKMVEAMCGEADDFGIVDKKAIEKVSEDCDTLTSEVRSVIYSLDFSRKTQQNMRIFITMKNTERIMDAWQNQLQCIISNNKIRQYKFEPERQLQELTVQGQKLGRLVPSGSSVSTQLYPVVVQKMPMVKIQPATRSSEVKQTDESSPNGTETSTKRVLKTPQDMTATRDERINVKTQPDSIACWVNGSVLTGDNMLAVADYRNWSVKMVDLNQKKVVARVSVNHGPWDITRVNRHTLAVTCPDGDYIQPVRVSRSGILTLDRRMQVGGHCRGISYIDIPGGGLVVSFTQPPQVKVMDMSGAILKDLSLNDAGRPRFNNPYHITISNDESTLIVSNDGNHTVTGLTLGGVEKFVYRDNELRDPRGVAVGGSGEIFVCGCGSNNIHVISSDGKKIKVLLGEKDGLWYPNSITYSDNKLFVGSPSNNSVDVHRIQYS